MVSGGGATHLRRALIIWLGLGNLLSMFPVDCRLSFCDLNRELISLILRLVGRAGPHFSDQS